jgi:hypothetical protein
MGIDAESFHLLLRTGNTPVSVVTNQTSDRLCDQLQPLAQTLRPSVSEPVQVGSVSGRPLFKKTGVLHSFESGARDMLCYWATEYLNVRQRELSWLLNITQSAVSMAAGRGRIRAEELKLIFEI